MSGYTRTQLEEREQYGFNAYGKAPIYNDAFSSTVNSTWANLKVTALNDTIPDMCYNKLLSIFIRDGRDAVEGRQKALFSYLKASGFSCDKATDGINRHYASLPSDNLYIKRVMKNLCSNYINPPDREFLDIKTKNPINNAKLIESLKTALDDARFDYLLNKIHQRGKYAGKCLAMPRIRRNKLSIQLLLPDAYNTVKDEYGEILEIYIPFYEVINKPGTDETETVQRFHYWNKEKYQVLDEYGDAVRFTMPISIFDTTLNDFTNKVYPEMLEFMHGYGTIPAVELNFDVNDGDGTEGNEDLYELMKAQLACNMLDYLAAENVIFSAISFWVFVNFNIGKENLPLSPGTALIQNNVVAQEGAPMPPEADSISQTTYYDSIHDLKDKVMLQTMKNLGLPSSLLVENPGLASGEALKVDYRELELIRREDVTLLKPFEKELLDKLLIVANISDASPYKGQFNTKIDYSIDYKELYSNEKTKEEVDLLEQKKGMGVISPLEYLRALKVDDNISTDEAAIEEINKNLEYFSQIKRGTDAGNEEINGRGKTGTPDEFNKSVLEQNKTSKIEGKIGAENNRTIEQNE